MWVYRLNSNTPEWSRLKNHIPLNKKWLEYIKTKQFIRYEDYYLNFEKTIKTLEGYLDGVNLEKFEKPVKNINRTYWSDNYETYFDNEVFFTLKNEFQEALLWYWPEKQSVFC